MSRPFPRARTSFGSSYGLGQSEAARAGAGIVMDATTGYPTRLLPTRAQSLPAPDTLGALVPDLDARKVNQSGQSRARMAADPS